MQLRDLARHLRAADTDSLRWRLVAEFLEEYRWEERPVASACCQSPARPG